MVYRYPISHNLWKLFFLNENAAVDHQNIMFVGSWTSIIAYIYIYSRIYVCFKSNTWPRVKVNRIGLGVAVWVASRHDIICGRREPAPALTCFTGFFFSSPHSFTASLLTPVRLVRQQPLLFYNLKTGYRIIPLFPPTTSVASSARHTHIYNNINIYIYTYTYMKRD